MNVINSALSFLKQLEEIAQKTFSNFILNDFTVYVILLLKVKNKNSTLDNIFTM